MAIRKTKKELKKLFISCPMTGREQKAIDNSFDRMHRIAEAVFDQKLEVINTYRSLPTDHTDDPKGRGHMLGSAYIDIASADYYIGIYPLKFYSSAKHNELAKTIGIPMELVDPCKIMPDAVEYSSKMFVDECFNEIDVEVNVEFEEDPYDI